MSVLRFVGIFTSILAALALVNVYVFRRASQAFGLGRVGKIVLAVTQLLGLAAMALARAAERQLGLDVAALIGVGAGTIELTVLISCGLLLVVDLLRGGRALARRAQRARRRRAARARGLDTTQTLNDGDATQTLNEVHATQTQTQTDVHATQTQTDGELSDDAAANHAAADTARDDAALDAARDDAATQTAPSELPRREFVTRVATGSALALGGGTALYGALFGRRDYRIDTVPVRIAGLPRTLDGFTIAQISDIHFGVYARTHEVNIAAGLIARARPDLVVITGDMIDHDDAYAPYLGQLIARVRDLGRHGVVVIPGNHDHYAGIERVLDTARRAGARVLLNEGRVIGDAGGGFALLGVDDVWMRREGGGPDLTRAIAMVPRDLPRILLCHNPSFFPESAAHIALQLSGHTHGGQINVGLPLADLVLPFGYVAGLYQRGDAQLYVNRGFGTAGPPSRVGSPPEITRLVLVAA